MIIKNDGEHIWALTAQHCIDDNDTGKVKESVYIQHMKSRKMQLMKVIKESSLVDLALLRSYTRPVHNYRPVQISNEIPALGDKIWTINNNFSLAGGEISKLKKNCPLCHGLCLELFSSTYFGYSGGGVFNENHELVGIIIEFKPGNGETEAVHQIEIYKFLRGEI